MTGKERMKKVKTVAVEPFYVHATHSVHARGGKLQIPLFWPQKPRLSCKPELMQPRQSISGVFFVFTQIPFKVQKKQYIL